MTTQWIWKAIRAHLGSADDQLWLTDAYSSLIYSKTLDAARLEVATDKAIYWALRLGKGGHLYGQVIAANLLVVRNHAGDQSNAFEQLRIAAEAAYPPGMHSLAICYLNGSGTRKDLAAALRWFKAAADAGLGASQLAVAEMLFKGDGGPQDIAGAWKYVIMARDYRPKAADALIRRLAGAN